MSAPRWRRSVIGIWVALAGIALFVMGMSVRNVSVFFAAGVVPPVMLLWLWNEDQPMLLGSLNSRERL
jgi:hypothetical protein